MLNPQRGHRHDGNATDLGRGGGEGKIPGSSLPPVLLPQASVSHWPNLVRNSLERDSGNAAGGPELRRLSRAGKK